MKFKIASESFKINSKSWFKFISDHPHGNFFQTPEYYNFYKSLFAYEPFIISCIDNDKNICGVLVAVINKEGGYLKSKFSRRCIIYGGPLVTDANRLVTDLLLKELVNRVKNKSIYIEFRNLFDLSQSKDVFQKNGFEYEEHYNFKLKILSLEGNLKKLNKTRRWEINKGIKEGAKIFEAKDLNEVKEFYSILKKLYKEKVKKPLPSFDFFEQFFHNTSLGKYFMVKYNDKIIGGTMCPIFYDKIYEWYECGLNKEYKNLYPGILATWAPIEYAAKNDLKYFDFLGAGSIDSNYGVREFKSKFGGELVNYGRYLRINKPFFYELGKIVLKVLKKI